MFHRRLKNSHNSADQRWRDNISLAEGVDLQYHVYLFSSREYGWSKIGISKRVESRLKESFSSLPFSVELITSVPVANSKRGAQKVEKNLHKYFSSRHIRGEWFTMIELEEFKKALELFNASIVEVSRGLLV
jgi:hypothetical protein